MLEIITIGAPYVAFAAALLALIKTFRTDKKMTHIEQRIDASNRSINARIDASDESTTVAINKIYENKINSIMGPVMARDIQAAIAAGHFKGGDGGDGGVNGSGGGGGGSVLGNAGRGGDVINNPVPKA